MTIKQRRNQSFLQNSTFRPRNTTINIICKALQMERLPDIATECEGSIFEWGLPVYIQRMLDTFVSEDISPPTNDGDQAQVNTLRATMNNLIDRNFDLYAIIEEKERTGQMFDRELLEKAQIVSYIQDLDLKIHLICKKAVEPNLI